MTIGSAQPLGLILIKPMLNPSSCRRGLFSVFAQGLTALPGANWYSAMVAKKKVEPDLPELAPVTEMPVRLKHKE